VEWQSLNSTRLQMYYDIALNFGGIGTIIGHEITHAFDDEGSKYDSKGNINNWWQKEDFENYNLKKNILIEQFSNYTIENEKVNGKLTLGENIADLGGVTISLESLKKYLIENPSENIKNNNFNPIQRFFINYSRIWASNTTKEEIKNRILTDVHSPPEFRVNGNLQNIEDFNLAFGFNSKNKNKVKIW
jgi:putative endopeptidase